MRSEARVGNGTLLPVAELVNEKSGDSPSSVRASKQSTVRAARCPVPPPPLPPGLRYRVEPDPRDLPPGVLLGALVLVDLCKEARSETFFPACSRLEGVHELIRHHPDLSVYTDALAGIVAGERTFIELRGGLLRADADLDAAVEQPLAVAVEQLGICARRLVDSGAAEPFHIEAHAKIVAGLATLDRLRAYLDAL